QLLWPTHRRGVWRQTDPNRCISACRLNAKIFCTSRITKRPTSHSNGIANSTESPTRVPPPSEANVCVWTQRRYGPLRCSSTNDAGGSQREISDCHRSG